MKKFAILTKEHIDIPGDERSKQAPGHGYPAHTITNHIFEEYKNKEDWESKIKNLANPTYGRPKYFKAIVFEEVPVSTEVKININES